MNGRSFEIKTEHVIDTPFRGLNLRASAGRKSKNRRQAFDEDQGATCSSNLLFACGPICELESRLRVADMI